MRLNFQDMLVGKSGRYKYYDIIACCIKIRQIRNLVADLTDFNVTC